jgi:hypothetical protein
MKQKQSERIHNEISRIFWEQWDPISVNDDPEARDEYDGYVRSVSKLLTGGASDDEMVRLLRQHETVSMGLKGSSEEHLRAVVAALRQILV